MRLIQTSTVSPLNPFRIVAALTALIAALALSATAAAQQPAAQGGAGLSQGEQQALMQQLNAKRQEIQQLNQKLMTIQESAMEANPDLEQQREDWVALVDTKMKEAGHNPAQSREKIQGLQAQLQEDELSQEESQAVAQQLRQEQGSLQQAQREILQDEQVKSERTALNQQMIEAMQEQNPRTDEIIAQLQAAQQDYRAIAQQAMQQSQGTQRR